MGLRVYELESVEEAVGWPLMRRGRVCAPFSACDWSGAKSDSVVLSPVKGSCCSIELESRENRREGIATQLIKISN
jgi:hypothetical protein